jgi:hypothetical protein
MIQPYQSQRRLILRRMRAKDFHGARAAGKSSRKAALGFSQAFKLTGEDSSKAYAKSFELELST